MGKKIGDLRPIGNSARAGRLRLDNGSKAIWGVSGRYFGKTAL